MSNHLWISVQLENGTHSRYFNRRASEIGEQNQGRPDWRKWQRRELGVWTALLRGVNPRKRQNHWPRCIWSKKEKPEPSLFSSSAYMVKITQKQKGKRAGDILCNAEKGRKGAGGGVGGNEPNCKQANNQHNLCPH